MNQQLQEMKQLRKQDSLKIDILTKELHGVVSNQTQVYLQESQKKDSLLYKQQLEEIKRLKSKTTGSPVVLESDTLYMIYTNIGPYTPLDRSKLTSNKIQQLAKETSLHQIR